MRMEGSLKSLPRIFSCQGNHFTLSSICLACFSCFVTAPTDNSERCLGKTLQAKTTTNFGKKLFGYEKGK